MNNAANTIEPSGSPWESSWKQASHFILYGLVLCSVKLDLPYLSFFMTAMGTILLLIGSHALRDENRWFHYGFLITLICSAYRIPILCLNTTIFKEIFIPDILILILVITHMILSLLFVLCLRRGLMEVTDSLYLKANHTSTIWLLILQVFSMFYMGLLLGLIYLIAYLYIIRKVFRLVNEIDQAEYSLKTESGNIKNIWIAGLVCLVLLIGCSLGYLTGNRYPMSWSTKEVSEDEDIQNISRKLISMGFPEEIIGDLTESDIRACENASNVFVSLSDKSIKTTESNERYKIKVTCVVVNVSEEESKWLVFHHFLWQETPGFCGTEAIEFVPAQGCLLDDSVSGQVLYDQKGVTYTAPFYSLELNSNAGLDDMDTRYGEGKSYAAFSYPGKGENQRGYIVSTVLSALPESDEAVGTWMRYTHQRKRFQYPVTTALTASTLSKVDKEDTFIQLYHDLQIGFEQQPLIKVKTYEVDEGVEVLVYEDEYDSHGNIIRRSDINRDGSVSYTEQYEYDDHDNLINKIIYTSGGVLINQYQLELDEAGKVIKRIQYSDNNQLTGYDVLEYDDHGNEIKEVQYDSKDNADSWIERKYDDEDKLIRTIIHYQDTATIIDYTYDSYGRLTKESRDENYTSYEYNSASSINPSKVTEYADGVTVTGYVRYEYDYYGNLTRCTQCNPEGIVKHEFVYENFYGTEEDSEYK